MRRLWPLAAYATALALRDLQTEKPRPRGRGSFNISVQSAASTAGTDSACVGIDVAARAEVIELCGVRLV